MRPELPYLAAGAIAITGGVIRDHGWPSDWVRSLIGTLVLVLAASATAGTKIGPLVHAVGLLLTLAAIMAAVRAAQLRKKV